MYSHTLLYYNAALLWECSVSRETQNMAVIARFVDFQSVVIILKTILDNLEKTVDGRKERVIEIDYRF